MFGACKTMSIRILLLEDNEDARFVFRAVLEMKGYVVADVTDEAAAIRMCECLDERFDLLIADVMLRGKHGTGTAKLIATLRPEMPILFTSGCPLETLLNRGLLSEDQLPSTKIAFLPKPFKADELWAKVRELLAAA